MNARLVGMTEIAGLLGVSRQRASQLVEKTDFPAPLAELAQGRVWDFADVEAWAIADGRLKPKRSSGKPKANAATRASPSARAVDASKPRRV